MHSVAQQAGHGPVASQISSFASVQADDSIRRLHITDPVFMAASSAVARLHQRLLCEERHDAGDDVGERRSNENGLVSKWRQKDKLKTTAVALVLCLNIGVDPPDVIKISPCARLECWVDPLSMQPAKALETIGKNLQAQYERWQARAKYKMHLDPTMEDVKKLCISCRRTAKNERVLFHYNGHGVPRPTVNGEIWVFNSRYTQYIPLSMYELQTWLGTPCIYVLDCSAAGLIINNFKAMMEQRQQQLVLQQQQAAAAGLLGSGGAVGLPDPMREIIVLGACGGNELLPQNPDLPADVFTACLTTPIKVALRWFCSRSLLRHDGISKELIDRIPGRQTDRKTPLGELNWIFTAITDTIAWNSLPRALFQKLFRQDLLVASLFRNFLLAERIMAASNCSPVSYPRLPPTHQHPMWQAWDLAAEMCLLQLPALLADPTAEFTPSKFFEQQLSAFELWLEHGSADKKPPEQLPIVLQVLLSQVHRLRALILLGRFLDMGSWAVDLALSVGIFPYVLKLLQTTSSDLRTTLVFIWAKILALDRSCQADLVKDNGHLYFLKYLDASEGGISNLNRAQAVFVLAVVCDHHPKGQALCYAANLLQVLLRYLGALLPVLTASPGNILFAKWICLCLGKLTDNQPEISRAAFDEGASDLLAGLMTAQMPELRAAAVFGLGSLIHSLPGRTVVLDADAAAGAAAAAGSGGEQLQYLEMIAGSYLSKGNVVYDASPLVRGELAVAYARLVRGAGNALSEAVYVMQDAIAQQQRKQLELLRRQQQLQQQLQQQQRQAAIEEAAAAAAAAGGGPMRRSPSGGSVHDSSSSAVPQGRSEASAVPAGQQQQQQQQQQNGSWSSGGSSGSPNPKSKSNFKSEGLVGSKPEPSSSGRLGSWGAELDGVDAAAAAAVGDGMSDSTTLLFTVLEQVLLLATDPSVKVARLGRQVLSLAGLDLAPVSAMSTARSAAAAAGSNAMTTYPLSTSAGSIGAGSAAAAAGGLAGSSGVGSSLGSLTQKFVKSSRSWRSGFSSASSQRLGPVSGGGGLAHGSSSSSPPSPPRADGAAAAASNMAAAAALPGLMQAGYCRTPYVLRSTTPPMQQQNSAGPGGIDPAAAGSAGSSNYLRQQSTDNIGLGVNAAADSSSIAGAGGSAGSLAPSRSSSLQYPGVDDGGLPELPASQIVKLSYDAFSRPIIEPMATAWREMEGARLCPWTSAPDAVRKAQRLREMEAARLRCRSATSPKIREQVHAIETGADTVTAVVFHSFHLLLISVDNKGYVRVNNGADGNLLNAFHVSNGAPLGPEQQAASIPAANSSAAVTYARQLNEAESNLLLTGAADGAVRVWRAYLNQGLQRMATAWQAVPIRQPPTPVRQAAAFALTSSGPPLLYAVGGCQPDVLQCWDLTSEMVMQQIPVRSSINSAGCPVAVDRLSAAQSDPRLLLTSCSDGLLRLFDLRASLAPVASIDAGKGGLAGMVLEPCGKPGTIVTGTCMGSINFMDIRMTSDADAAINGRPAAVGAGTTPHAAVDAANSGSLGLIEQLSCSVVRTVVSHSKGGVSVLVAHPNAPLLATGTTSQVVKVWTDAGDSVGTLHQRTQSMQHKMGPVTCMAWHPYNLYLGAAGTDSVASVYIVDNVSSSNANSGVSYAPTSVSSVSGLGVGSVGGPALQSAASMLSASSMASSATLGV